MERQSRKETDTLLDLSSFGEDLHVAVVGAGGGLGQGFVRALEENQRVGKIFELGRQKPVVLGKKSQFLPLDLTDEGTIEAAAEDVFARLDIVLVATGVLHNDTLQPEKTWRQFSQDQAQTIFQVNAFGPMTVAKHFLPKLRGDRKAVFAALSAKVGSISDNELGGWYSYRASKAALNQYLRCAAIELRRKNKHAICVGLHPGTVATKLSAPFQANVAPGKLFGADPAARQLLSVIDGLTVAQSGNLISWDGTTIEP